MCLMKNHLKIFYLGNVVSIYICLVSKTMSFDCNFSFLLENQLKYHQVLPRLSILITRKLNKDCVSSSSWFATLDCKRRPTGAARRRAAAARHSQSRHRDEWPRIGLTIMTLPRVSCEPGTAVAHFTCSLISGSFL